MFKQGETKHESFLRLMLRRLTRAREELRLVSQLASPNYENTPEEAEEVVRILDEKVRAIADVFDVEYATRIGRGASHITGRAQPIGSMIRKVSILDEIEIMKALEHLRAGRIDEVDRLLRSAITGRAA